jgi:hypothetical protein
MYNFPYDAKRRKKTHRQNSRVVIVRHDPSPNEEYNAGVVIKTPEQIPY